MVRLSNASLLLLATASTTAAATAPVAGHPSLRPRAAAPAVSVNVTTVVSGDTVLVSWEDALRARRPHLAAHGLDELLARPMRTVWDEEPAPGSPPGAGAWRVEGTSDGDGTYWLGQFSPAVSAADAVAFTGGGPPGSAMTPPFTTPAPVKFISGTQLAAGEWPFVVTNGRHTVNWVLFAGSLTSAAGFEVLALSPAVSFADAARPTHVRLARTPSTDEMRVSWTSAGADAGAAVQWGLAPDALDRTTAVAGEATTYAASDLCGSPASTSGFHDPGFFHTAVIDLSGEAPADRSAGLTYHYRVGSDALGWSAVHSFRAPKPAGAHVPLSVVVTADMGETYEDGSQYHWEEPAAVNTTLGIESLFAGDGGVDVVMHPGDLSYATGYESEWDRFMEAIEPVAASAPYMTGQGNHERDFPGSGNAIGGLDSGGECGVPTQSRFRMPTCPQPNTAPCIGTKAGNTSAADDPTAVHPRGPAGPTGSPNDGWYSFDQGPVHFLNLNTEMASSNGTRQFEFVAADLAAVDRDVTPWVFVFGHRQMYSGNSMAPANAMGDLEPLLLQYKVDIAFWGHIHFAQQSCAMYKAKCVTEKDAAGYDAPIHVVIGNAGQSLTAFPTPKADWSLYEGEEWGFSHVAVSNATHLTFSFFGDTGGAVAPPPLHHTFDVVRKFPRV